MSTRHNEKMQAMRSKTWDELVALIEESQNAIDVAKDRGDVAAEAKHLDEFHYARYEMAARKREIEELIDSRFER